MKGEVTPLRIMIPHDPTDSQAADSRSIRETVRAGAGGAKGERPEPPAAAGAGTRTAGTAGAGGGGKLLPLPLPPLPLLPANKTSSRANLNGIPRSCTSFAPSVLKEARKLTFWKPSKLM